MTRPWFRMYREERGTFAQLPFVARAMFREILTLTDDAGVIPIGPKAPAEAIAFALGADRADRRILNRVVPLLLADGCLVHEGATLRAPNFPRFQADVPRPHSIRSETTQEPVTGHSGATPKSLTVPSETAKGHVSDQDHSVARAVLFSEEKSREDGEKISLSEGIRRGYCERFARVAPGTNPGRDASGLTAPVWGELARETGSMDVAARLLDAAFADDFVIRSGWLPNAILGARTRLLVHGPSVAKRKPGASEPASHEDFRERVEAQAGKGATHVVRDL